MSTVTQSDRLRAYLRTLAPSLQSALITEIERGRLQNGGEPRSDEILSSLRLELRRNQIAAVRVPSPSRVFFEPVEWLLIDEAASNAGATQIARASLSSIWAVICSDLAVAGARRYVEAAKKAILLGDRASLMALAEHFRGLVSDRAREKLNTMNGRNHVRERLSAFGGPPRSFDDLCTMLRIFQSCDAAHGTTNEPTQ